MHVYCGEVTQSKDRGQITKSAWVGDWDLIWQVVGSHQRVESKETDGYNCWLGGPAALKEGRDWRQVGDELGLDWRSCSGDGGQGKSMDFF